MISADDSAVTFKDSTDIAAAPFAGNVAVPALLAARILTNFSNAKGRLLGVRLQVAACAALTGTIGVDVSDATHGEPCFTLRTMNPRRRVGDVHASTVRIGPPCGRRVGLLLALAAAACGADHRRPHTAAINTISVGTTSTAEASTPIDITATAPSDWQPVGWTLWQCFVPSTWRIQNHVDESATLFVNAKGDARVSIGAITETEFMEHFRDKAGATDCLVNGIRGRCTQFETDNVVGYSVGVFSSGQSMFVECGGLSGGGLKDVCSVVVGSLQRSPVH